MQNKYYWNGCRRQESKSNYLWNWRRTQNSSLDIGDKLTKGSKPSKESKPLPAEKLNNVESARQLNAASKQMKLNALIKKYGLSRICQKEHLKGFKTVQKLHNHIKRDHPHLAVEMGLALAVCEFCHSKCFSWEDALRRQRAVCSQRHGQKV